MCTPTDSFIDQQRKIYSRATLPQMIVLALTLMLINHVVADSAEETMKCVEQLSDTGSCAPYLGGAAKAPTADCCSGLEQAIKTNKKCVCLVLKHRDDPDLGMKINISIAAVLPSICKFPDNISECPAILHLDPKSPEARAFNQMGQNSTGSSVSPSPTFAEESFRNDKKHGADETATAENGASDVGIKGLLQSFVAVLLIWLF